MVKVSHISDTAKWVAAYRALETERPDALFRDPHAARLSGALGQQLARELRGGLGNAWIFVVRTKLLDDWVERLVREERIDLVLNLAAGFDARPYRLALPATLRWAEVDLPALLAEKEQLLAGSVPRCQLTRHPLDLADRPARQRLLAQLGAGAQRVLVLTEGLLVYLTPAQAGELAMDLAAVPSVGLWALDLVNHRVLKIAQRQWGRALAAGNAQMKFGPRERFDFFRPLGFRERESQSFLDAGVQFDRQPPFGTTYRWIHQLPLPHGWRAALPWAGVGLLAKRR